MEPIPIPALIAVLIITGGLYGELRLNLRAGRCNSAVDDAAHAMATHYTRTSEADARLHAAIESVQRRFAKMMTTLERIEHAVDGLPDSKGA